MLWASEVVAQEFVCFVYHRFGDGRYPSTNIDVDTFRGQLEFLRDEGFTVVTLGDALHRLEAGTLVGPTVVLTVDDGYASFRSSALPVLREFNMPATLFVNTASVGGADMLSWDELSELAAQGMEIGNHTASHEYFLDLPTEERQQTFRADVSHAQEIFLERLGQAPTLFSYPFGEYDPDMRARVKAMGFTAAVAQHSGVVSGSADRYALPRFPMGGPYASVAGFTSKARMRALPVIGVTPESRVLDAPPQDTLTWAARSRPWLAATASMNGVRWSGAQCFVAGVPACSLLVSEVEGTIQIRMRADEPSRARRTLYTITAPSVSGPAWYWFSHVWIRPESAR